jgi:hypothetical protein
MAMNVVFHTAPVLPTCPPQRMLSLMIFSASAIVLAELQAYSARDMASVTGIALGAQFRVKHAMQMSRSVIMPLTVPLSSTTGMAPQSASHISFAGTATLAFVLQLATCLVISSLTFIVRFLRTAVFGDQMRACKTKAE